MKYFPFVFLMFLFHAVKAQQNIGIGTTAPEPSALLELKSSSKGILPPRMTLAQVQAIPNPAEGLLAYDSTTHVLRMYNGTAWVQLTEKQESLSAAPGIFVSGTTSEGTGKMYPVAMDVGQDNSIYITGYFTGSVTVSGITINSNGGNDIFFLKIESTGSLAWLKSIGGSSGDETNDIAVDADGSFIIVGHFEATIDFDPGAGIQNLGNAGSGDAFYAKYTSNGSWAWSKAIGGTGYDRAHSLDISGSYLYITGYFIGTGANFNPVILNSTGLDMFLCRYQTSDGNLGAGGWVKQMGGSSSQSGYDLKVSAGLVHVGGYFASTTDFGGTSLLSAGGFDGFFARYYLGGSLYDVYAIGGLGNQYVQSITTDAPGNIYCGGIFEETADFNPGAGVVNLSSYTNTTYDGFIAKYSPGGSYAWAKSFGNTGDDYVEQLMVKANGDVLAVGTIIQTVSFYNNSIPQFSLASLGSTDAVIISLDALGNYKWAQQAGGLSGDKGMDILQGPNQSIVILSQVTSSTFLNFQEKKEYTSGLSLTKYFE